MPLKLEDIIDIRQFQMLQDRLNEIYSFPSAIIDNEGNVLTATAWQDICTKFHRRNGECLKECIKSDQYILEHLHEANPAVTYRCPHGLIDNATPIIIEGVHYGNFFTGQFFLEPPDLDFFRAQAKEYGFDAQAYLEAVKGVPIWTRAQLNSYLFFIKGLIEVISAIGLKNLKEIEARKKIQVSEERHRAILHTAMDGFWRVDTHGRLREVNETYSRMSGYSISELLAMRIPDLEAAESLTETAGHMQKVVSLGEDRFESRHRRKDGSLFDVEVSVQYRPADGGQVVAFLRDITDRKVAEAALRASEEKFRTLYESMAHGVFYQRADGTLEDINPAGLEMFGITRDQFLGRSSYHPEWKVVDERYNQLDPEQHPSMVALRTGQEVTKVVGVYNPAIEAYRWLVANARPYFKEGADRPYQVCVTMHDITDQKRAAEALRASEERLQISIDHMVDAYALHEAILDDNGRMVDYRFLEFNPAAQKIANVTREAIVGKTARQLFPHVVERKLMDRYAEVMATGVPAIIEDFYYAGDNLDKALNITCFRIDQYHFVCMFRDITDRKRAEEELRDMTERLRLAKDSAKAGVWDWNVQTGEMIWDDRMFELYGLTHENFPGGVEAWEQGLHPDDASRAIEECEAALRGERDYNTEFRVRRPDGAVIHIKADGTVLHDQQGRPLRMIGLNADITERKRADQELALIADIGRLISSTLDIEEVYERMALQIKEVIPFDGVNVNLFDEQQEMARVAYSSGERIPGRMVGDTFPVRESLAEEVIRTRAGVLAQRENPEDLAGAFPSLIDTARMGLRSVMSVPLISRDRVSGSMTVRSQRPFAFTQHDLTLAEKIGQQIAGTIANARLYRERKRAEHEMAMLAEIGRVIGSTLSIEEVYAQFATMTKQIIGFDLLSVNVPDIRNNSYRVAYTFGSVMPGRTVDSEVPLTGTMTEYAMQMRKPVTFQFASVAELNRQYPQITTVLSIHYGFFSNMLVPLFANDAIVGILHFRARQHDAYGDREVRLAERVGMQIAGAIKNAALFAERNRAEEEKERLQSQLMQAQKMESVGRLAGGVAHDFNNMLGVILGHLELATDQLDSSHPLQEHIQGIRRAAERSAELTHQLLAFARKQVVRPRVIDLNETVEGSLKMLRRLIGEDIDLVWMPRAGLSAVKVDPAQIDQVLANLCVNARDAIAGVGKITIATDVAVLDAEYCDRNPGFVVGDYVLLTVSDTGCGMDEETMGKLFEPFFTTKEVGKGTGLGLAMIYGIVKQNQGCISVQSEPGLGATFKIYLPRHVNLGEQLSLELPKVMPARGRETILLVEDEPEMLTVVTLLLQRQGYTVFPAATPAEALRIAKEYKGRLDLLITDVVMPEMNGRELAQTLLRRHAKLRRLFMSGYTAEVIAHHGILEEGVHFIQKPFSIGDIAAKVREALGQ